MQYHEEAKQIWKSLVPESGQASTVQGELLRQIEKLRYEAQDNGNINWDTDFDYFCDFLSKTLSKEKQIPKEVRKQVINSLSTIKRYGQNTWKYNHGKITEEKFMKQNNGILAFAYVEDDLYDTVVDAIVLFSRANPEPISFTQRSDIHR